MIGRTMLADGIDARQVQHVLVTVCAHMKRCRMGIWCKDQLDMLHLADRCHGAMGSKGKVVTWISANTEVGPAKVP
jgi:hypothetical protein